MSVLVGAGRAAKKFDVHEAPLVKHSEFFRAALGKEWQEGKQRVVKLPKDVPEHFELFANFLYTGQIFSAREGDQSPAPDGKRTKNDEWQRLSKAWVFGDKVLSTSFKDAVVDATISNMNTSKYHPLRMHLDVYPSSKKGAKMRQLLVDLAAWGWSEEDIASYDNDRHAPGFYAELAIVLKRRCMAYSAGGDKAPYEGSTGCHYHEHVAEDKPCYKTMF